MLELMPALSKMRLLRQWAGLCDMTPDFSPIMGGTEVGRLLRGRGLGDLRVQGGPGVRRGHGAVHRHRHARPRSSQTFGLSRFTDGGLVGEKGAAAVGH